jgi:transcriptional regulator with XRE-family HTH domain
MTKEQTGQRVLWRRRKLKLSQKKLAELSHIPTQVISGVERGEQDVHAQRLAVLAQHLGVSADYLLGLSEKEEPSDGAPRG